MSWADLVFSAQRVGDVGPELSAEEKARAESMRVAKRREEFIAGRQAARGAVRACGVSAFRIGAVEAGPDSGRPCVLPPCGVSLSIAHSEGWAVAVAARTGDALGVDLEPLGRELEPAFLEEAFADGELEGFARALPPELPAALSNWVLKEAALKVWGVGLRAPLGQVRLVPSEVEPCAPPRGTLAWQLRVTLEVGALPSGLGRAPLELRAMLCLDWPEGFLFGVARPLR